MVNPRKTSEYKTFVKKVNQFLQNKIDQFQVEEVINKAMDKHKGYALVDLLHVMKLHLQERLEDFPDHMGLLDLMDYIDDNADSDTEGYASSDGAYD